MGEHGYGYSTYNTVGGRTDESVGPLTRKSFVPFVPNSNYSNYTDPYGRPLNHEALASRPARFSPSTDWRQSPPYTGSNAYGGNYSNRPIVRRESYYENGYGYAGGYNNKESYNPIRSTIRNDSYDGYGGNYSSREGYKPVTDGFDRPAGATATGGGWTRPKIGSSWSTPPRKGPQLATTPTSNISKAVELVKEAERVTAIVSAGNNNGSKQNTEAMEVVNEAEELRTSGYNEETPTSHVRRSRDLVKEAERIKTPVTGPPTANKDYYRPSYDNSDVTRRYGNMNFSSGRRTTSY